MAMISHLVRTMACQTGAWLWCASELVGNDPGKQRQRIGVLVDQAIPGREIRSVPCRAGGVDRR